MKTVAVLNVLNEEKTIVRAIESVLPYFDEIHVWDGAYRPFPISIPQSTDRTKELCSQWPSKVFFHDSLDFYNSQVEKRSLMFSSCEGDCIFFKLDGDEIVLNPEQIPQIIQDMIGSGAKTAWTWHLSNLYKEPYMKPCFFRQDIGEQLCYKQRHHWLCNTAGQFITSDQKFNSGCKHIDTNLRIFNQRNVRPESRSRNKMSFVRERNHAEMSVLHEKRIGSYTQIKEHKYRAGTPRVQSEIFHMTEEYPEYTLYIPFSRIFTVDNFFSNLKKQKIPEKTELFIIADTDDPRLYVALYLHLNGKKLKEMFVSIRIYVTKNEKLPEYDQVVQRRLRIISNWHIALTEARGEQLICMEDDSVPVRDNTILGLVKAKIELKANFVQGDIIGRWDARIHPAWQVEERNSEPWRVYTLTHQESGVSQIQGCGWYCFVADTDMLRSIPMEVSNLLPLGPDVNHGFRLHKAGYRLFHVWDYPVKHLLSEGSLIPGRDRSEQRIWAKVQDKWKVTSL